MGLDMYLSGRRYLLSFNDEDKTKADTISKLFPELSKIPRRFGGNVIREVFANVGYWRKANAIHNWFVKNCQGGKDDCGNYYVGREQLQELRDLCQGCLDDRTKAQELLPPTSGFFFGSTEVDEYYFQDLEQTIKIIDQALTLPDSWDFEYHSSW